MSSPLYIICVDDEKIVLDSLSTQLSRNLGDQFNYEFAQSAEEALEVIEEILEETNNERIYVVISDWLMPGMKGDEFLDKVKEKLNGVKTILLTGHMDNSVVEKVNSEKSTIHCIHKPWNEKDLLNIINA